MKMKRKKRLVKEVEFKLGKGKTLVISYTLCGPGLDRVIVENKEGIVAVRAEGRSRFEFSDDKISPYACDFWLANPKSDLLIADILLAKFWGQFNFGQLRVLVRNKKLNGALNREAKKLVQEFEERASARLNRLVKKHD